MHPNWVALSTCIIRKQNFVTPKEKQSENKPQIKNTQIETSQSGIEISKLYDEIVNAPSTIKYHSNNQPAISFITNKIKTSYTFNNFCQAATSGNTKILQEILKDHPEFLSQSDQYEWTALMMAACDGATESFKLLINAGCDPFLSNKTGQSAYSLAKQKGHTNLLNVIFNISNENNAKTKNKEISPFYCELCEENFKESTKEKHQTSTLHQFNLQHHNFPTRFGIGENNRGFQLMVKQGWDRNSGLGPSNEGHLFPIKTQIRDFRTGLGVDQNCVSRVTHYKSHDISAIKRRQEPKPYRRRDLERDYARDKRRERIIRDELS